MGWFGMPGCDRESAFKELFSQAQYTKKFELIWQKHMKSKSIAVYRIDGKLIGETILWADREDELIYKPVSWVDSLKYIPKMYHKELLENSSQAEKECYEASRFSLKSQDAIQQRSKREYTWDELYERAMGCAFLSPELCAKDRARENLRTIIMDEEGYDIEACECPEEEIDTFLWKREKQVLFDEDGNIIQKEEEQ